MAKKAARRLKPAPGWYHDKGHPLWTIIILLVLTGMLYMNATRFDSTEGRTLLGVIMATALREFLGRGRHGGVSDHS